jgi:hypothetical protein
MINKNVKTTTNFNTYMSNNQSLLSLSQNSFNKSMQKSTDTFTSYIPVDKNKKELKMNYLNDKLNLINEYKKPSQPFKKATTTNSPISRVDPLKASSMMTNSVQSSNFTKQNLRTKLIPREKFMNSSMTSTEYRKILVTTKEDVSRDNTDHTYLDNDLEQLDYKGFENSLKREAFESNKSKHTNYMYNSEILDLLSKKHLVGNDSKKYTSKRTHVYTGPLDTKGDINADTNSKYMQNYNRNTSVPKIANLNSFCADINKLNTSNMTLESKPSDKSFNNNILFTDGGITNINIHSILSCEDIPNEIYFNDKRYKALKEEHSASVLNNNKSNEVIKELMRTIDILKCCIKYQEVIIS